MNLEGIDCDAKKHQETPPVTSSQNCPKHGDLDELAKRDEISLDYAQLEIISSHAEDVLVSAESMGPEYHQLLHPLCSVVRSFCRLLVHLAVLFFSNPLGPIVDFSNHFYGVVAYLIIYLFLFIFQALLVVSNALGFDRVVTSISKKYAGGYNVTAWADITMFDDKADTIQASYSVLSSELDDDKPLISSGPRAQYIQLIFSLEVAKSILLMSSIIYERDKSAVIDAFEQGRKQQTSQASGSEKRIEEAANDARFREEKICQVTKDLWKSEKKIHKAAKEWGCKFISIADFQKAESPFAGAFYDLDSGPCPFMVVVFKGTSPGAISEWIVDGTLDLECSSDKLGAGFAHHGFYTSLFPSSSSTPRPSPYLRIINAIKQVAQEWRKSLRGKANPDVRMNLFVGGHSLGAAIASLFYARLLESPEDLGEHIILRDAYCFGTPRACDGILASRFEYNLSKPKNIRRAMWRMRNRAASRNWGDIITYCPPGMADIRAARAALSVASFLSYAAIGIPIDLEPKGQPPFCTFTSVPCGYELNLSCTVQQTNPSRSNLIRKPIFNPIILFNWVLKTVVPVLHDHFPGSYYKSLDKIGNYQLSLD